jgi:diguanylate cyclase (GGDEF)-like protein
MTVFSPPIESFVAELDGAIEAHLGWTRRILRCAVLRTSPGEDVLAPDAHLRCHFGHWFVRSRETFEQVDAVATLRVLEQHERMHDAMRALCTDLLAEQQGNSADLDAFEARQSALVAELANLKTAVLACSARHDALTGLPLRYGLEEEFMRSKALANRSGQLMVLILADVDHFKQVNDIHGHSVGDRALCHVASILRAQARADEPVFRFGGEEFLVILHATNESAAGSAADRLLQALRDAPLQVADGVSLNLRVSAGLAVVGTEESLAQAVERADTALYAAKRAGRDRWTWSQA